MSSLQKVKLSNNQLKSNLSEITLPDEISSIDLHKNQLSGSLSAVINNKVSSFWEAVDVSNNQISGTMPEFNGGMNLKLLNIGSNKIEGQIPSSISNLIELERLDISRNKITGTIPTCLGLLVKMQWLDVSVNGLMGRIPESLMGIENLRHANFRANRLCGEIPQGRPYNIFPAAAYTHNLCVANHCHHVRVRNLGIWASKLLAQFTKGICYDMICSYHLSNVKWFSCNS
ncbi:leucine-rich repeat (LRR) family protein [Actinidia rufa]|uniref:Leucine-rich repeat (LRR) family protein n=1 Tax=Actinidia rufa TaxID=165716 RepID=A0A7J0H5E2_9ERIC|nr:leucine-rich repeat (LRR) family protein [Actinidia rufa]